MTQLVYKITAYNPEQKRVRVSFDDGAWAEIPLMAPLPTTLDQLDLIVRQFAAPKEIVEARQDTTDMGFLEAAVGQERTTDRFSLVAMMAPPPPPGPEQAAP